jgi:FixJ family two-component response regulator
MGSQPAVPLIGIVDDDESVRDSISSLIRSAGYRSMVFASAEAFLNSDRIHETACLVLDIRMPGLSGLDLQRRLSDVRCPIPIIFVTAHADDEVRARALKQGAVAVLPKPFGVEALLGAIRSALESSRH